MSLTLANIPVSENEWVDLYLASGIEVGRKVTIDNVGDSDIYYTSSVNQPDRNFKSYNTLKPRTGQVSNKEGDQGLWALSLVEGNAVNVSVFVSGEDETPRSAYSEISVVAPMPVSQISAEYGLIDVLTVVDNNASGTSSVIDNQFNCQTGSAADGLASIVSRRQLKHRPGQGSVGIITAVFDVATDNNQQLAGLITAENIFALGYLNTNFGIVHAHGGVSENQELTISTPASGSEDASITIDGNIITVPLTAGTAQHNAFEIANSLTAQVTNYSFTSNDNQVVAQGVISGPQGSFAFSSATAVAAWIQQSAGTVPIVDFTPQSAWSEDTRITSIIKANLIPQNGNVYKIQYTDFGAIKFSIQDRRTGSYVLVHIIQYANSSPVTSVTNPTTRVGWLVRNVGNTSNVTVSGSSASSFTEGFIKRTSPSRAVENNQPIPASSTFTNIVAFRNRTHFSGKVNRLEIFPLNVSVTTQANKFAFFKIIANPVFGGDLNFSYVNKDSSIMEIAKDSVIVSGGELVDEKVVVAGSIGEFTFNIRADTDFSQLPGDVFCIAGSIPSGAADDCQATGTWQEDK